MVAPESSPPPASGRGERASAKKPATEPLDLDVTERRRTVAVAGHRGDEPTVRTGMSDPAPSVRVSALGGLLRLSALSDADLAAGVGDPAPSVRRRAVELSARFPGVIIDHALSDPDSSVVEMTAWSMGEREDPAFVPALSALASAHSGHTDPLCREAAVAALGAIGDPAGLAAILSALDDKPNIRRRAAVALAPFEGPEVEAALRRCLDDRDWQVRQVAEDLLSVE
jgi:HEAT repeat protein